MRLRSAGLLERGREVEVIERALRSSARGDRLILIEAGAGLGKSALLALAAERAREVGLSTLTARGIEHEQALPFGAVLQIFEPALRQSADPRGLLEGPARRAADLFGASAPVTTMPAEAQTISTMHGLFWLMSNLCQSDDRGEAPGGASLVLLIDDLHWVDLLSLRFLLYLAHRLDQLPVLMVLTARRSDTADAAGLAALRAHPLTTLLRPQELSPAAVARLLGEELQEQTVAEEFAEVCARVTGGNPFLLRELATELDVAGVVPDSASAAQIESVVPESVLNAVVARLVGLSTTARSFAQVLAVVGDGTSLERVRKLSGIEPEEALTVVHALAGAGILRPGRPPRFAHPLVASALAAQVPELPRADIELRAARLLAAEGEEASRVALHLLHALVSADPWVVETLQAAAARASGRGDPALAARYLRRALSEPPAAPQRAGVLVALGLAEAATDAGRALSHLGEALDLTGDAGERAHILSLVGRILALAGRHAEAFDTFQRAAGELPEPDRELQARMIASATQAGIATPEVEGLLSTLRDRPGGSELPLERRVMAVVAARSALSGENVDRFASLALRAAAGESILDELPGDGGMTVTAAAIALLYADELEASLRLLDGALLRARRDGLVLDAATISYLRAWPLYFVGRLQEAITDAEQALCARAAGWSMHSTAAATILAHARIERGDIAGAHAALADAEAQESPADAAEVTLLLGARGRLRLVQRDPRGALRDLLEAARRQKELGISGRPLPWRATAALAALALGDSDRAISLAAEELERAELIGARRTIGMALRVAGVVNGGEGGLDLLRRATLVLEGSPARLEEARALVDLGAALRRGGASLECRDPLRRGRQMAERCGALALAETARQELITAGARPRRAALGGVESLTGGELRVARLAASGLTNREIAQQLFVSVKTVEYHLRHAYHKLDIPSRAGLVAALEQVGQDPPDPPPQ